MVVDEQFQDAPEKEVEQIIGPGSVKSVMKQIEPSSLVEEEPDFSQQNVKVEDEEMKHNSNSQSSSDLHPNMRMKPKPQTKSHGN